MPSFRSSITIRGSASEVWDAASDSRHLEGRGVRLELDPPGPHHVGQRIRRVREGAAAPPVEAVITEYEPARLEVLEWSERFAGRVPFRFVQRTEIDEVPGAARVTQSVRMIAPNPVAWCIAWLGKPFFKKVLDRQLEKLKGIVEGSGEGAGIGPAEGQVGP